jgi:hypothetical protein
MGTRTDKSALARSHSQKKGSDSTPVNSQLRSRPFAPPAQPETSQQETPDLQTQLENAQRFGHSFSKISASRPSIIQPKLTIGTPGDKYEQEADRVAAQVVQQINAPQLEQPQPAQAVQRETLPDDDELQMKPLAEQIQRVDIPDEDDELQMKPMLQRKAGEGAIAATPELETTIQQSRGSGQSLAESIRQPMEQAFNADFTEVIVHADARSDQLNRSIQAKAFTTGQDIFFRQGAYQPGSQGGQELLAHELTHVVQQNGRAVQRSPHLPAPLEQLSAIEIQAAVDGKNHKEGESASSNLNIIQRKIGFEIETGIPITHREKEKGTCRYYDIDPEFVGDDLVGHGGKISPDHIPGNPAHTRTDIEQFDEWPIIEFVTDPVADDLKIDAFETIARGWIDSLKVIKGEAKATPPAKQFHGKYYVGLPTAQNYANADWDRIAPQATVDVPLDQVGKILSAFDPNQGIYRAQLATQIGQQAPSVAAKVMQTIYDTYPPGMDQKGTEAVKSLVMMLVNHLMIGESEEISKQVYMKNRPANIMYKTKLSTVRNNIVSNQFAAALLKKKAGRKLLLDQIIAATGRNAGDSVFVGYTHPTDPKKNTAPSTVTVEGWIKQVLNGSDDQIFEEMKNPWSDEIVPKDTNVVAIELRRLGAFVAGADYSLEKDDGLLAYLKKVYGLNQLYKQRAI